jgi:hypothetical protein
VAAFPCLPSKFKKHILPRPKLLEQAAWYRHGAACGTSSRHGAKPPGFSSSFQPFDISRQPSRASVDAAAGADTEPQQRQHSDTQGQRDQTGCHTDAGAAAPGGAKGQSTSASSKPLAPVSRSSFWSSAHVLHDLPHATQCCVLNATPSPHASSHAVCNVGRIDAFAQQHRACGGCAWSACTYCAKDAIQF